MKDHYVLGWLKGGFMACRCESKEYCDHYGRSFCNKFALCYQAHAVKQLKTSKKTPTLQGEKNEC